jgi:hypothetical protein
MLQALVITAADMVVVAMVVGMAAAGSKQVLETLIHYKAPVAAMLSGPCALNSALGLRFAHFVDANTAAIIAGSLEHGARHGGSCHRPVFMPTAT